ncbi:Ig domain-containing protein [Corynebacterium sp. Q4381]|uniref:Ig domain-containing protein n=1 Tax=Corynebacterium sp. Marseille-Q4381 TaxID=3121597 RepID=UPI002FE585A5
MAKQSTLQGFNARAARVGMTGAIRRAALGTPVVPLGIKFDTETHTNKGYTSPDGLEISFDEEKQEYIPWQEVSAIRTDITKSVKSIKYTLWETNLKNIADHLGVREDDIVFDNNGTASFYEDALPVFPYEQQVFDVVDGDTAMRLTAFNAQLTGRGAMVFKKDQIFGLEQTITTFPAGAEYEDVDSAAVGRTAHWQFNDAWAKGKDATSSTTDGVRPLTIATAATLGSSKPAVSKKITANGGTSPYTYEVSNGALPKGVTLDEKSGEIKGTATESGTTTFTVKVTDAAGLVASRQFTMTVTE